MKNTTKITAILLTALAVIMLLLPVTGSAAGENTTTVYELGYNNLYAAKDNTGYNLSSADTTRVSVFPSGHSYLGTLKAKGNVERKSYKGYDAIAVKGSEIRFEYNQTWLNYVYGGQSWKLSQDSATSINGYSVGTIGDGAILILKSYDGFSWQKVTSSVHINGVTVTFTPDGSDVQRGVYLRFISVCEAYYTYQSGTKKVWKNPFKRETVPVYSDHYENLMQVSTVYVASDSAQVGFYSQATDEYEINTEGIEDVTPQTVELLKKGTSLTDGSLSLSPIRLDKLGNRGLSVSYSHNGSEPRAAEDGQIFDKPGRYHFVITTTFGSTRELDLCYLDPGDDLAHSLYFPEGLLSQGNRVFDGSSPLPSYTSGSKLSFTQPKNAPALQGGIYSYTDLAALEGGEGSLIHSVDTNKDSSPLTLTETGYYLADLYVGNPEASGEVIHYCFLFAIAPKGDYRPSLNYALISSPDRRVNLCTSAYAVSFATAGGGSYVYMFPRTDAGYEAALQFAEEIEYRFVEEFTDRTGETYYYYKAHGSSGLKERFDSKVELYAAIERYSTENVNTVYVNNTESYATVTLDEAVANIENTSIRNDIRVCINAAVREELTAGDIILNGYKFYQAAEYESDGVTATSEEGRVYEIPYDTDPATVLDRTGRYLITEQNTQGTREYYVYFFCEGDVTGELDYVVFNNYSESEGRFDAGSSSDICGNVLRITGGSDRFDSQTLLTLSCVGWRESMLLSEAAGYTLTKPGIYTLTLTNRCGYSISTTVTLTEMPRTSLVFAGYEQYNRSVVYGEALGELPTPQRYGHELVGWLIDDGFVTADTVCTYKGSVTLVPLFVAERVDVILNYFNGYEKLSCDFGSRITLPDTEDIDELFTFAYWDMMGEAVTELEITSLDTVILVAKYFRVEAGRVDKSTAYSSADVAHIIASRPARPDSTSRPTDEAESGNITAGTESASSGTKPSDTRPTRIPTDKTESDSLQSASGNSLGSLDGGSEEIDEETAVMIIIGVVMAVIIVGCVTTLIVVWVGDR